MTERDKLRARLMLVWSRTLEDHRIADFDDWLVWVSQQRRPHVPPAGRTT